MNAARRGNEKGTPMTDTNETNRYAAAARLSRRRFAGTLAGAGLAALAAPIVLHPLGEAAMASPSSPSLSEAQTTLLAAQRWLNTAPLLADDVSNKVLLVNFWTYSCINSLRPLPYVRAWADKYKSSGLVVIGVHTPEFAFERDAANIGKALARYEVGYPVAIDSDYRIWQSFANDAWPAFYFVGADGRVRERLVGEGSYAEAEHEIQKLLAETRGGPVARDTVTVNGTGAEAAPDFRNLRSDETYVGYAKATNFRSPGGARRDRSAGYQVARHLSVGEWGLTGTWSIGPEFAAADQAGAGLTYRFHARDLHLVMGPASAPAPVRFRVTLDGAAPGADHGTDTDAEGWGAVQDPRLYQLVRQSGAVKDRTIQIEFFEPGARAYAFTFG